MKVHDIKELILSCEKLLAHVFHTKLSKIGIIKDNNFLTINTESKLELTDDIRQGGIMYEVYTKARPRFSESLKNDVFFNSFVDIDSELPGLTCPVMHPTTNDVCAVFQVVIWQETFQDLTEHGIDLSNEIFSKHVKMFGKFFGFTLALFRNAAKQRRRHIKKKDTEKIYEVSMMKIMSKRAAKFGATFKAKEMFLSGKKRLTSAQTQDLGNLLERSETTKKRRSRMTSMREIE